MMGENPGRIFEWRPRIHLPSQRGIRIQYDGEQCIVRMNDDVVTRVALERVLGWVDPSVVALTRLDDNPQGRRPLFQCYTPLYFSSSQTLVLAARIFFNQGGFAVNFIRPLQDSPGEAVLGWGLALDDRLVLLSPVQVNGIPSYMRGRLPIAHINPMLCGFGCRYLFLRIHYGPVRLQFGEYILMEGFDRATHWAREQYPPIESVHNVSVIEAPYRQLAPGLNLWGRCETESYEANNQWVMIHLGIGNFDLLEACREARCPSCSQLAIDVRSCGFHRCFYQLSGRVAGQCSTLQTAPTEAPQNALCYFYDLEALVPWEELTVTTSHHQPAEVVASSSTGPCDPLYWLVEEVADFFGRLAASWQDS